MRRLTNLAAVVLLSGGLTALSAIGPLASTALAATPQVTITCTAPNSCTAGGTGFTPSGTVVVQASVGGGVFSSSDLVASPSTLVCVKAVKPICWKVGGGTFAAPLPVDYRLVCDASAAGTVSYTDATSHAVVTEPVTFIGPCANPTTTTLLIPSTVDTGWASNPPATVTAGSASVLPGTITVNGTAFCSYPLSTGAGCTLANLPAGTDRVQATYSGSSEPIYDASSASATVTVLPVHSSTAKLSGNWAGYAATGETYTSVSATWTVPTANCGTFPTGDAASSSATWVGLDGDGNTPVEQIGTDSNCAAYAGEYHAWWEMAPGGPTIIGDLGATNDDRVSPGDVMAASVTATSTPGTYTLTIDDLSQGWSSTTTQSNPSAAGASAECIVEQPSDGGLPLTNFGSVTFSQCKVTGSNGIATPIWDHANDALTMASASTTKATVLPLSDDGTQFTVTWLHG
jgi:Peptidase A4 family